ncbi:branched-chain amino acid ABC transporter substrate-binding protein [Herbaspirillum sp.]|uniref:branched-chain amino acid ABC transporter substrate-binding protein n=1 Tax=Herbaspirillum sp. TaxID=1890675 RepID=UPI0031DDE2B0
MGAVMLGLAGLGALPAAGQAAERIVQIGLAAPMSGLSGSTGISLERAAQLAIDDVNETQPVIGGDKITFKLLPQDDRADPRTGELIAEYLVKSRVAAVVGHWNSGVGIPASRIYAAAGIPHVSPAVTSPAYTQQGYPTAFRVVPHDGDGARHTAEYVVREMKARNIVVIDDRTVFGADYAAAFEKSLAALNTKAVAHYTVSSKSSTFNQILPAARSLNPDVILFAGIDAQAAQLASELRRLQIKATLVGIGGMVGPTFLTLAGPAAEGTIVLEPGPPSYKGAQWSRFENAWKARYKEDIYLYAPFAYDAVRTIVAAMREANSVDTAKVTAALHKIRYRGITGPIAFDKEGNLRDPVFTLYEIKGGRWKVVKTFGEKN